MMMWATIDRFFYHNLVGISEPGFYGSDSITPGFREFRIQPRVPDDLQYAGASIRTVRGTISSKWRKDTNALVLDVSIPVNSTAEIHIPRLGREECIIKENEIVIWKDHTFVEGVLGVLDGTEEPEAVVFHVGSGIYQFVMAY